MHECNRRRRTTTTTTGKGIKRSLITRSAPAGGPASNACRCASSAFVPAFRFDVRRFGCHVTLRSRVRVSGSDRCCASAWPVTLFARHLGGWRGAGGGGGVRRGIRGWGSLSRRYTWALSTHNSGPMTPARYHRLRSFAACRLCSVVLGRDRSFCSCWSSLERASRAILFPDGINGTSSIGRSDDPRACNVCALRVSRSSFGTDER